MSTKKRSRASSPAVRQTVAAAVTLALNGIGATIAGAQDAEPRELPKISVEGADSGDYKSGQASSLKYTAPLLDTPQTLTVIPRKVIEEQSLLTLREILTTVPGITFGAGEGGGGYGDSINLRGFAGSNDITVDGIRDSAQYTRSDPFNLEQVEVVNGASSVYTGAGAVGGSINLVSKAPLADAFARFSGAAATDDYERATADVNHAFGTNDALRVNAMWHQNDVPGRDVERFERWGIAPSVAFGLGEATTATLSYFHQSDDNVPQYGVPTFRGKLLEGADIEGYYGYRNIDRQEIDTDVLGLLVKHDFSERLSLRNQTRAQRVDQLSRVDPPQGTFCLASTGLTPIGDPCVVGATIVAPGFFLPAGANGTGPRGTVRDTRNEALINQTDLTASFATGRYTHTLVTGLSIAHETFSLRNGNVLRNPDGSQLSLPQTPIDDPDSLYTGTRNYIRAGETAGKLNNQAIYVFDTLKLSERWQLNGGVRYEHNDGSSDITSFAIPAEGGTVTVAPGADSDERLLSYRAGLVYKPAPQGTLYLAYGNSQTPSKASVNGSCTLTPTNNTGVNCNVDPEEAVNYEFGAKWDLLDAHLGVTAAVFRNERTNYRVNDPGNPDNPSQEQRLDGRARVDGVTLGLGGMLREDWGIFANYSWLDSKVLQGASDYISSLGQDYTRGDPLLNVPKQALSLWTVYDLPYRLQIGYGLTYQDKVYVGQHSATNLDGPLPSAARYAVHRAMLRYGVNRRLDLQLNVNNLFDKEYLTRVRTSGEQAWATPGEGRQVILTASCGF